jgi:hypothetical protein
MVMSYNWKCECGSVFMTETLLKSHKLAGKCKPNKIYELKVRIDPSKRFFKKKVEKESCPRCGGKGYVKSRPCPERCYFEAESLFERFVQNQWRITDRCLTGKITHTPPGQQ